jgi:hypothetical protein
MKNGDKVAFLKGKRAGQVWFVHDIAVGYWDDDNGVRHANYTVSVVPKIGAFCALDADYDNLKVVEETK